mgnify:CR=1 FL=1
MLTPKESEILEAYLDLNDRKEVAAKLGITTHSVRHALERIEKKGEAPWLSKAVTPEHLSCAKTTVQYDGKGNVVQEWKRLFPRIEALNDVVDGLCERVNGKAKVPVAKAASKPTGALFELCLYDAHVGMYADERETNGEDYDCDIAAKRMVDKAAGLLERANKPEKIVVVFGGDMLHADNRSNKTELSGNVLDVDSRYQRVVSYVIAACSDVVALAATKAPHVEVVVLRGNHSWHSEVWLARVLDAYYSKCPNVTVDLTQSSRVKMVWGENLIIWAHGDRIAANKWGHIIPAEFPREWGNTRFRYLHCGHVHHQKKIEPVSVEECAGLVVEYVPALCAADNWHAEMGYVGQQKGAVAFEYLRDKGMVTRFFESV